MSLCLPRPNVLVLPHFPQRPSHSGHGGLDVQLLLPHSEGGGYYSSIHLSIVCFADFYGFPNPEVYLVPSTSSYLPEPVHPHAASRSLRSSTLDFSPRAMPDVALWETDSPGMLACKQSGIRTPPTSLKPNPWLAFRLPARWHKAKTKRPGGLVYHCITRHNRDGQRARGLAG